MGSALRVSHLTKDYGGGRGIFDVSIEIALGECFGFLGPNGAGKTTTIRHIMGFSTPDSGSVSVLGCACPAQSAQAMAHIGYLPGEIALPDDMTARTFLEYERKLRGIGSMDYCEELQRIFELETDAKIGRMSLGQRRKLAVVAAFMHDPDVLVLDEPTSGLDPIMQDAFIDFVREQKRRGKTILLSSHIFNEVAATCDRIAIIKAGRIVEEFGAGELGTAEADYRGSLLSAVLKSPLHAAVPSPSEAEAQSSVLCAQDLTKDYGRGCGIFNLSFAVRPGEVLGLVGTNGSGKTTTIRTLLGFIRATSGQASVLGSDAWAHAAELKSRISYIPGELQFPRFSSADAFFDYQSALLGLKSRARRDYLIDALALDSSVNPRKMSKGMKQKTAIVAALMAENDILVLDEPTTGLDPVMRDVFVGLIKEEKASGKTIFMSSHIFEEIEEVCDRVAVIHEGRIVDILTAEEMRAYSSGNQNEHRMLLEGRFKEIFRKGNWHGFQGKPRTGNQ